MSHDATAARGRASNESVPDLGRILDVRQTSARTGISRSTLAKMRMRGDGPPFLKIGKKAVRYPERPLEEWLAGRICRSTSGPPESSAGRKVAVASASGGSPPIEQ